MSDTGKPEAERRTHWGFVSQEVEKAMHEHGMNSLDFAGLIVAPIIGQQIVGSRYGLRYEEFISMAFAMFQDHERRIEVQEKKIAVLETRLAALETK